MGTHPIFESDFDCLTEFKINDRRLKIGKWDGVRGVTRRE